MKTPITATLVATLLSGIMLSASAASQHASATGYDRNSYTVKVDKDGVMRRSDTGAEVSYFGTNYTLPFAYSYRFAKRHGVDIKACIDNDVYHMKRLGFNGFRLHLWDVELSDSVGNLLQNDHLDYLDYMIASLEREGIDVILTAQTNFGNGYPEKDIDTGAYTYMYPKCGIHEDKRAQQAQERYLKQLVQHRNPYTGRRYADDKAIIAVEINNEPCHGKDPKAVTDYINRMERSLRSGGFDRIVLYNVSHNPDVTDAYYKARIQGTTYQWYPVGLVAGHERRGNFLPYVASYDIPWRDRIPEFKKMSKVVYEFDAGDVLCTYLYPPMVRAFRNAGFQWATHFAYDPTPIAAFNTEYQTHYLNLLYTPGKAVGIAIAAEAMRTLPMGDGSVKALPTDTVFGDVVVSAAQDFALLNAKDKFYHTRTTDVKPQAPDQLRHIMGVGSNVMVSYDGTGAYFLDKESDGWRLELMPDVRMLKDPFSHRVEGDMVAALSYEPKGITMNLPGVAGEVSDTLKPGLYKISYTGVVTPEQGRYAGDSRFATLQGESVLTLYTPVKFDDRVDLSLRSGGWQYDRQYRPAAEWWNPMDEYEIAIPSAKEADAFTWRCYVGEETKAYTATGFSGKLEVKAELPEDAEIAIVMRDGTARSVKCKDFRLTDGYISIPLEAMQLTYSNLIPQAYPTFLPREKEVIYSATSSKVAEPKVEDIEFVEIRFGVPAKVADGGVHAQEVGAQEAGDTTEAVVDKTKLILRNVSLKVAVK